MIDLSSDGTRQPRQARRPPLLAFETALEQRPAMLTELAPELQGATRHMHERLTRADPKPS